MQGLVFSLRRCGLAAVLFAAFGGLALAACVDGKTPDCSDAAAKCGPDLSGAVVDASADSPADAAKEGSADGPAQHDAPNDTGLLDVGLDVLGD